MKDSRIERYVKVGNKFAKQREKLGKHPKCPKCKNNLSDSIVVPYFLVCVICECYWNPSLTESEPIAEVYAR